MMKPDDLMEPDEEVRDIITRTVKTARLHTVKDVPERIMFSDDAFAVHDDNEQIARATIPETGETVILVPDPKTILTVRCANCDRRFLRSRRNIERMNRKYGFPYCNKRCRTAKLAEKERIFVPDREPEQ